MKISGQLILLTYGLLFFDVLLAQESKTVIERTALPSRVHQTWEGAYKFSGFKVVKIEGMKDLYVLIYRNLGKSEGHLVDFAVATGDKHLRLLFEADTDLKGVVPILEGVEVFPGRDEAEVIVRWRHPGNGGFRTVEKYRYSATGLSLMDCSEFMMVNRDPPASS